MRKTESDQTYNESLSANLVAANSNGFDQNEETNRMNGSAIKPQLKNSSKKKIVEKDDENSKLFDSGSSAAIDENSIVVYDKLNIYTEEWENKGESLKTKAKNKMGGAVYFNEADEVNEKSESEGEENTKVENKISQVKNRVNPIEMKKFNGVEVISCSSVDSPNKPVSPKKKSQELRKETFIYDNLALQVRGFNNMSVFESNSKIEKLLNAKERRYTKNNIDNGKLFFKMRYITDKFEELVNMNSRGEREIYIDNRESVKSLNENGNGQENKRHCSGPQTHYSHNNLYNLRGSVNYSNGTVQNSQLPLNVVLNEDKNVIKFNSIFLQKLEKGIFSFNLKKYEDSYNYLLGSGIVKNEAEFGELLLVITGFDKYIVGDFLSKEKTPNKEKKVLKAFMKSMDFTNARFLDAFRFLLSRLNLPKDASLILEIIDAFSIVYYEDNKHLGNFKDTNSIYLLSSSVLALNTMFSRSDIKDMKVLKKEDFVKMNKDIKKEILEAIYEELKVSKMDIVHDYNEVIYKRLSIEAKSGKELFASSGEAFHKLRGNNKMINEDIANNINNNQVLDPAFSDTSVIHSETKAEEIITLLKAGEMFTKYGNYGEPHPRMVKLKDDERRITWFSSGGCSIFKKSKFIEVSDIKDVYIGGTATKIFEKYHIPPDFDSNCFSIVTSKRSLDLRIDDENICKKWYQAIKFLIRRAKSISELKNNKNNLKDSINKNEIISEVWKTEILPNWHIYRKFVVVKGKGNLMDTFNQGNGIDSRNRGSNSTIASVNKKNKEKFFKLIFKNTKNSEKLLDEKDKGEFLYLWTLGIPEWLRKKIWGIVIGNELGITENLFNYHLKQVELINFEDLINILLNNNGGNMISLGNHQNAISSYNTVSLTNFNTIKLKAKLHVSDDLILNEIINDVFKIVNKFSGEIKENNVESHIFMQDLFKIVRVFTLFRPDIIYSKHITYISAVILLHSENFYTAFVSLVNFCIPSFIIKFLTRDEIYIRIRLDFFEKLLKNYIPSVYKHFVKMDVTTSLYFFNWIENVYIKTFKYETFLRIWDIYLLKGEVFLYEVALCLIKIQEKDLTRIPVKDILENLKKMSYHINEDEFFDLLQEIDISEDYKRLIYENSLAREKGVLFQSYMIEWI